MNRSEIRGTVNGIVGTLIRARQALLDAAGDTDVILTPADMDSVRRSIRDAKIVLRDIEKVSAQFGAVADARSAMVV